MPVEFTGDTAATRALTCATTLEGEDGQQVGTAHVLIALQHLAPGVKKLLDAYDITQPVLHTVYTRRAVPWSGPDGTEATGEQVTVGGEIRPFTAGLRAALIRCPEPRTAEAVLAAILDDDRTRAAVVLRDSGAEPDRIRHSLRTGQFPLPDDRVAPELRATRDRLLGRTAYRGRGLRARLFSLLPIRLNWALTPVMWASLEADEIARHRGGPARTDDVLVAALATYQVTTAYPHLTRSVPEQYEGVRALVEAGLDHRAAAAASATLDLGDDAVPPKRLLKRGETYPRGTGALIDRLLAHEDNRAARLMRELGVTLPRQ